MLRHPPAQPAGEPQPRGVRDARRTVARALDRGRVIADAPAQLERVAPLVRDARRVAPRVAPLLGDLPAGDRLGRGVGEVDVQRAEAAPVGPRDVRHQVDLVVEVVQHAQRCGRGQPQRRADVLVEEHQPRGARERRRNREVGVALDVGDHLRAVVHPEARVRPGLPEQAEVGAQGVVVRLQVGEAVEQRGAVLVEVDGIGQVGLDGVDVEPRADAELVVDLIGDARADVDRLDLALDRHVAADPVGIVLGGQAEGGVDGEAGGEAGRERIHEVEAGHDHREPAVVVAAGDRAEVVVLGAEVRAVVAEIGPERQPVGLRLQLDGIQPTHAGRVEEDRAGVLGRRGAAGEGVAEARDALLEDRVARAVGRHGQCERAGRDEQVKQAVLVHGSWGGLWWWWWWWWWLETGVAGTVPGGSPDRRGADDGEIGGRGAGGDRRHAQALDVAQRIEPHLALEGQHQHLGVRDLLDPGDRLELGILALLEPEALPAAVGEFDRQVHRRGPMKR